MIPSQVIQVSMLSITASWATPLKYQNPTKNPIRLDAMLSSAALTSSTKIQTVSLRCVSTSTCVVSIKRKIQKLKMNWLAQMGKSLDV